MTSQRPKPPLSAPKSPYRAPKRPVVVRQPHSAELANGEIFTHNWNYCPHCASNQVRVHTGPIAPTDDGILRRGRKCDGCEATWAEYWTANYRTLDADKPTKPVRGS